MSSETQKNRILFIKSSVRSLDNVEKYLKKKGYEVLAVVELKPAILKALQFRPDYILIPMDHPNTTAKQLPKIFRQVLQSHVIPYSESQSASAILDIKRQGERYNLIPPILGPKVERMINRILLDEQEDLHHQRLRKESGPAKAPGNVIKIKGGNESATSMGAIQADMLLEKTSERFENGVDTKTGIFESKQSADQFMNFLQKAKNPNDLPPKWRPHPDETQEAYHKRLQQTLSQPKGLLKLSSSHESFYEKVEIQAMEARLRRGEFNLENSDVKLTDKDIQVALLEMLKLGQIPKDLYCQPNESSEEYLRRLSAMIKDHFSEREILTSFARDPEGEPPSANPTSQAATLSELVQENKALFESVNDVAEQALLGLHEKSVVKEKYFHLDQTSEILCLQLENEKHKGYAVVASAREIRLDDKFKKLLFEELHKNFVHLGIEISEKELFSIEMKRVPFTDWVKDQAEFLFQSSYEGDEIGISYFPVKKFDPDSSQDPDKNLIQIPIDDLKGDRYLPFDLYLYLPLNKHVLMYTQRERMLFQQQLDRLIERGIKYMYVNQDYNLALKKYQTQNFIDAKIETYLQKIKASLAS